MAGRLHMPKSSFFAFAICLLKKIAHFDPALKHSVFFGLCLTKRHSCQDVCLDMYAHTNMRVNHIPPPLRPPPPPIQPFIFHPQLLPGNGVNQAKNVFVQSYFMVGY